MMLRDNLTIVVFSHVKACSLWCKKDVYESQKLELGKKVPLILEIDKPLLLKYVFNMVLLI